MKSLSRLILTLFVGGLLASLPVLRADDTVYTKVDENPVPLKTPPPEYPAEMKSQGVSGIVAVSIVIDETGVVTEITVAKSSHPEFEKPAMDAVKRWKFKPAKLAGNPVKVKVTLPVRFTVQ